MTDRRNRRILLAARPHGAVTEQCCRMDEAAAPVPGEGEALVRTLYLSLDPTIRGWMERDTYLPAIPLGDVVRSGGVGEVVASRCPAYRVGDLVFGMTGWQEYCLADAGGRAMNVVPPGIAPTDALGVYGVTGLTAYFGLLDVGRPAPGETVLVSAAAGATGSVAGQIAKIQGCRAVGLAGTPEKCRWVVDELGFDACIDYRREDVPRRLRETCPDGVDVYFDNVGGAILEAALDRLRRGARVVLCGAIAIYNEAEPPPGPRNYLQLVIQRARMEGFLVLDYASRFPEAIARMAGWVAAGRLRHAVDVAEGLENAPAAFLRLFRGENRGKQLVKVAERETRPPA
jgi:NADPH-dependent curcumin reductase CurA